MKVFNSKEKIISLFENQQNLELQKCYDICKNIAKMHYENFPVGSLFIPKNLRKHFYAIYSFARIADDISDENYFIDKNEKLFYLEHFKNSLIDNNYLNPIIKALNNTIQEKNLPYEPFIKLIDAFKYDVDFKPFKNWDEILKYCDNSANPIGELILRLFNNYDNEIKAYSDAICSGLQLINFWQDLSVDILKGRNYIPIDLLDKYGIMSLDVRLINKLNIQQLLNERLSGLKFSEIRTSFQERVKDISSEKYRPIIRVFLDSVDKIFTDSSIDKTFIAGTKKMLSHPEFFDHDKFQSVIELVENKDIIIHVLDKNKEIAKNDIAISIGNENKDEKLSDYSMISKEYKIGDVSGHLGIIGPKRMEYSKLIAVVDYVAKMLTETLKNEIMK